jgi:hypothetical protein
MSEELKVRIEQFKSLTEDRKAIDRQMWQVPVATLGIIAVVGNALRAVAEPMNQGLFLLLAGVGMIVPAYAALLLGRLHSRRELREQRLVEIERLMLRSADCESMCISTLQSDDLARKLQNDRSPVNQFFARVPSTPLGIMLLLLIALTFAVIAVTHLIPMVEGANPFLWLASWWSIAAAFVLGLAARPALSRFRIWAAARFFRLAPVASSPEPLTAIEAEVPNTTANRDP